MKILLSPNITPPKPIDIYNLKEYERYNLLLKLKSCNENNNYSLLDQLKFNNHITSNNNNEVNTNSNDDTIDLFEGDIQIDLQNKQNYKTINNQIVNSNMFSISDNQIDKQIHQLKEKPRDESYQSNDQLKLINKSSNNINKSLNELLTNVSNKVKTNKSNKSNKESTNKQIDPISKQSIINSNHETKKKTTKQINITTNDDIELSADDFKDIAKFCRNVGSTNKGYQLFKQNLINNSNSIISLSVIWNSLSTNHISTNTKYCTPSSSCTHWNCICDKHIRIEQAYKQVLGVLVVFSNELDISYLIPLTTCYGFDQQTDGVNIVLPLTCEISLYNRVELLHYILTSNSIVKVIFNISIALLPIIHIFISNNLSTNFTNIFDMKLANYIVSTVIDNELELTNLFTSYSTNKLASTNSYTGRISYLFFQTTIELSNLLSIYSTIYQQLLSTESMYIYSSIELPICLLLSHIEYNGIIISINKLQDLKSNIINEMKNIQVDSCNILPNQIINFNSPEQLSDLLYNQLQLPSPKQINNNINSYSKKFITTSEDHLNQINHLHPIVNYILEYRSLNKILNTFIDGLNSFIFHYNQSSSYSKIHAIWNQTVVRTGRLSCCKPNLQNIPKVQMIRGIEYNIRSVFEPSPGCILISADYSQIEMRILAYLSNDQQMKSLFTENNDIYLQLASRIFNKSIELIDSAERTRAKTICLGLIYGMGIQTTANKLGLDIKIVNNIVNTFLNQFKSIRNWINNIKSQAKSLGYVKTLLGRRRYLPDINSTDTSLVAQANRQAVNTVIQGTASDIIKYAMLNIENNLSSLTSNKPKLLLQIHDELIYELPVSNYNNVHSEVDSFHVLLLQCMQTNVMSELRIDVPIIANIKVGYNWGEMIDIDEFIGKNNLIDKSTSTSNSIEYISSDLIQDNVNYINNFTTKVIDNQNFFDDFNESNINISIHSNKRKSVD